MCKLGIGGFMGIEDINPGMKATIRLTKNPDHDFHGEVLKQYSNQIILPWKKNFLFVTVNPVPSRLLLEMYYTAGIMLPSM